MQIQLGGFVSFVLWLTDVGCRCTAIVDGIVSEFQRGTKSRIYSECDSEEGAKLFKILETAAEPELLMAEMSPEQLTSFASYQTKIEVIILLFYIARQIKSEC